jgi:hypothetical protein
MSLKFPNASMIPFEDSPGLDRVRRVRIVPELGGNRQEAMPLYEDCRAAN